MGAGAKPTWRPCRISFRHDLDGNDFADAFWRLAQCWRALEPFSGTAAGRYLMQAVMRQYDEVAQRLDAALRAVCANFNPDVYAKVRRCLLRNSAHVALPCMHLMPQSQR